MTTTQHNTREEWLNQAADLLFTLTLDQVAASHSITKHAYKISVGKVQGTHAIGCCYPRARSESGINELFLAPHVDCSSSILATLVHELLHALDDCQHGHKGTFAKMATQAGLIGKMTATTAGEELQLIIDDIIDALGNIPHTALDTSPVKKQATRSLLVECTQPDCDWRFRITRKHYDTMTHNVCLSCHTVGSLQLEQK
jgi:hypothetical protein